MEQERRLAAEEMARPERVESLRLQVEWLREHHPLSRFAGRACAAGGGSMTSGEAGVGVGERGVLVNFGQGEWGMVTGVAQGE